MKVANLESLKRWVSEFAPSLSSRHILLLQGEMGVGKTQLVRFLVEAFGGSSVASPTFAIHHVYPTPTQEIHHLDLYRIESLSELEAVGFWDLFLLDRLLDRGLIIIEWAERVPVELLPGNWACWLLELKRCDGETRQIEINRIR